VRKALGSCDRRKRRRGRDSGIVGGGATAEAFQVLIGRSMDALRVLVRRTTFDGVGELAQHLRDRTVAKGTTVDISAEVAKRGGPGPITRATSTPQRISAENPDRLDWKWTAMRNWLDVDIRTRCGIWREIRRGAGGCRKPRART
jgi:hypothetical protein